MRYFKLLGLAFIAALSLTSIAASAASAAATLPSILPTASKEAPITATALSATSTFGGGLEKLTSATSAGTQFGNSAKLGSFDTLFLKTEIELLGTACKGLEDTTAGSVLVLGTFHIRDFKENGTLLTAVVFLLKPVHFECGSSISIVVSGCVAGALTPENVLTKFLLVNLAKNGTKTDNLIITVLAEEGTAEEACQLLAKKNAEATELSVEVTEQKLSGFLQSGTGITVLVMRL